jgi:hypothetical protein
MLELSQQSAPWNTVYEAYETSTERRYLKFGFADVPSLGILQCIADAIRLMTVRNAWSVEQMPIVTAFGITVLR